MTAAPIPAPRNSRVGSYCAGRDQTFPASKKADRYSICDTRMPISPVIVKNAFPKALALAPFLYDPNAANNGASANAFGKAFFTMTGEIGMRVSQMLYLSAFFDAGNVWARPAQYDPTRLFGGAGIGAAVISPLGPLGIDYA